MSNFKIDFGGADMTNASIGNRTVIAKQTFVGGNRTVNNVDGDQENFRGAPRPGAAVPPHRGGQRAPEESGAGGAPGHGQAAATFDIKAQNAKANGVRVGDTFEDRSVSIVLGSDTTNHVKGNQVNRDTTAPHHGGNATTAAAAGGAPRVWALEKEASLQQGTEATAVPQVVAPPLPNDTYAPSTAASAPSRAPA